MNREDMVKYILGKEKYFEAEKGRIEKEYQQKINIKKGEVTTFNQLLEEKQVKLKER